jgi:hypothetical protein
MSECVQRDENGEVIINNIFNFRKKETVVKKPPKDNRYSSLCNTPEVEKKVKVQPDSFSVYSHRYTVGNVRF